MLRFIIAISVAMASASGRMGGVGDSAVTPEAQAAVKSVWPAFGEMAMAQGRNGLLGDYKDEAVVEVKKQVVAGINYFVKVQVGSDEYAHLRIYDRFGDVKLAGIQLAKSKDDELAYFEP